MATTSSTKEYVRLDVIEHLEKAGLWQHVTHARVMSKSNQVEGWLSPAGIEQLRWLSEGICIRLRRGPWWLLHRRVGKKLRDYRADEGVFGPNSMQVVASMVFIKDLGHAFYADIDSDSPNQDLVRAMKHIHKVVKNQLQDVHGGPTEV